MKIWHLCSPREYIGAVDHDDIGVLICPRSWTNIDWEHPEKSLYVSKERA
jgi:hypothetical protein